MRPVASLVAASLIAFSPNSASGDFIFAGLSVTVTGEDQGTEARGPLVLEHVPIFHKAPEELRIAGSVYKLERQTLASFAPARIERSVSERNFSVFINRPVILCRSIFRKFAIDVRDRRSSAAGVVNADLNPKFPSLADGAHPQFQFEAQYIFGCWSVPRRGSDSLRINEYPCERLRPAL